MNALFVVGFTVCLRCQLAAALTTAAVPPERDAAAGTVSSIRPRIGLAGPWGFYADVGDRGLDEVVKDGALPGAITVPGAWQAQGYGEPGGSIPSSVVGPDSTPAEHLRHNLTARCLYVKTIYVPPAWKKKRVFLCIRRVYRYADVTINEERVGDYEGFCSPFEFDVTESLGFGTDNRIVIGVDNRPRRGRDTVGTANYLGNWGGLGGDVYLEARPALWIHDVFAMPRVEASEVCLRITLKTMRSERYEGTTITADVAPWHDAGRPAASAGQTTRPISVADATEQTIDVPVALSPLRLWSPDSPFLYTATVQLMRNGRTGDQRQIRFGMREITARGRNLFLNDKPLYLSGYGDDATEPVTGMLPGNKAVYVTRLRLMRSLGFNFVRHHSCIPHDEYLQAADEVGILVQPEAGMAYIKYWPKAHELFSTEWPNMVTAFRNHPSIWAWCMGNELFLHQLPERDANPQAVDLSRPIVNGPLQTVGVEENGVYGPRGTFPSKSFKQSNYYRDVEVLVQEERYRLLGEAMTQKVFTDAPHELGLKFTSRRGGHITRMRYFRVSEETGSHVGRIWNADGRELVKVDFTGETKTGWQEAVLPRPLAIRANAVYVVSVNANRAYAATQPGKAVFTREDALDIVERAYRQAKELDPTRLVHTSDGGDALRWTDIESPHAQPEKWQPLNRKPRLLHEYGNYCCSLPDFSLIPRLNGVIRPLTYERAARFVRDHQLESDYERLYHSSLFMRAEAQKTCIEAAKADGGNSGFSFWLGIDFPDSPEGCWDEGFLNQLWEPKPHLTGGLPDIAGPTVLLCNADVDNRSFFSHEPKRAGLSLWHYGSEPISDARLVWRLTEGDTVLRRNESTGVSCGLGKRVFLGDAILDLPDTTEPRCVTLQAELLHGPRRIARNAWEFYAYPRPSLRRTLTGVYSEIGPVPGAAELQAGTPLPDDLRLLITRSLKRKRHEMRLRRGRVAVLLLGTGGFRESRHGYFLNSHGGAFGGVVESHPVFAPVPHQGRIHASMYHLVNGGGLLNAEAMPAALRSGSVIWGLKLTAWISPTKDLQRTTLFSEVRTHNGLHLILCNLDLTARKPESRYVMARTIDYLLSDHTDSRIQFCSFSDLEAMLK